MLEWSPQAATAIPQSERLRGEIRAQHQGVLPESHDIVRRGVVADSHSKLRRSLSQRAPSSRPSEPTHQPRSGPPRKRGKGPTPAAPGWHAELLLPGRCLSYKSSATADGDCSTSSPASVERETRTVKSRARPILRTD